VDWCLPRPDPAATSALRREIARYLHRHAAPGEDVEAAEVAISEILTNSVLHAPGPVWVMLDWRGERPLVEVHDLGPGFTLDTGLPPADSIGGRGLYIVDHLAADLRVASKRAGGTRVSMTLEVRRLPEGARRRRPPRPAALPTPEEAGVDGTFGRESFLRALVVNLASSIEAEHGPAAAGALIEEVGTDVGGRMEDEYRRARGIVGRLSPEQMGELFVRLKAAIGGDFHVISIDDEQILLGNTRCPFGDAVRRAPGLCHMTASVFGGIAARNGTDGEVRIHERISAGDPGCLVSVRLTPAAEEGSAAWSPGASAATDGEVAEPV
jgi:anti-sigma regulatory factor (Ser/Thr protein kinase)/predicted ArsR family transcriptional regulator